MIVTKHIPPWKPNLGNRFFLSYATLIENLKSSIKYAYADQDVLLIDNTYLKSLEVVELVKKNNNCQIIVIVNVLDPPQPWDELSTTLQSAFPDKIFRYVGNESPDIEVIFWFLLCNREFTRYKEQEVSPTTFDYVFLNYNFKPHEHRVKLIQRMKEQNLLDLGYWTLDMQHHQPMARTQGLEQNLGDLNIWQKHFLNITSKTLFCMNREPLIIGEKVFKPILGLRPFVLNGSPRYYEVFKQLGFDCFDDIWPVNDLCTELDTLEATMNRSHQTICDIVKDLSQDNLPALYKKLLPRLRHNRDLWYNLASNYDKLYSREIIKF